MNMHTRKAHPEMIRALAKEGHSQAVIAIMLGVSRERIRQICNRDGIETLPGGIDYDLSDRMVACAERGLTIQQAAAELGRHVTTLYQKAGREGIKFAEPEFRWHEIRAAAAEGLTMTECARRMGWPLQAVWNEARRHGIIFHATKRATRQSAVKGVSWNDNCRRWLAQIRRDGKTIYLGSFVREEDAIAARKAAEESK